MNVAVLCLFLLSLSPAINGRRHGGGGDEEAEYSDTEVTVVYEGDFAAAAAETAAAAGNTVMIDHMLLKMGIPADSLVPGFVSVTRHIEATLSHNNARFLIGMLPTRELLWAQRTLSGEALSTRSLELIDNAEKAAREQLRTEAEALRILKNQLDILREAFSVLHLWTVDVAALPESLTKELLTLKSKDTSATTLDFAWEIEQFCTAAAGTPEIGRLHIEDSASHLGEDVVKMARLYHGIAPELAGIAIYERMSPTQVNVPLICVSSKYRRHSGLAALLLAVQEKIAGESATAAGRADRITLTLNPVAPAVYTRLGFTPVPWDDDGDGMGSENRVYAAPLRATLLAASRLEQLGVGMYARRVPKQIPTFF
jgi:hypothetical protein